MKLSELLNNTTIIAYVRAYPLLVQGPILGSMISLCQRLSDSG